MNIGKHKTAKKKHKKSKEESNGNLKGKNNDYKKRLTGRVMGVVDVNNCKSNAASIPANAHEEKHLCQILTFTTFLKRCIKRECRKTFNGWV